MEETSQNLLLSPPGNVPVFLVGPIGIPETPGLTCLGVPCWCKVKRWTFPTPNTRPEIRDYWHLPSLHKTPPLLPERRGKEDVRDPTAPTRPPSVRLSYLGVHG